VPRPAGFWVLPRRWVVEPTFAWLSRRQRLSQAKDHEGLGAMGEAWIDLAMIRLLARRLAPWGLSAQLLIGILGETRKFGPATTALTARSASPRIGSPSNRRWGASGGRRFTSQELPRDQSQTFRERGSRPSLGVRGKGRRIAL